MVTTTIDRMNVSTSDCCLGLSGSIEVVRFAPRLVTGIGVDNGPVWIVDCRSTSINSI